MKSAFILSTLCLAILVGCDDGQRPSADQVQSARQETIQGELAAQMGMPSIKNGAEMRLLKMIYEMRDQNRATFTYTFSEYTGKFRFLGNTVGFGIPYAAQYSSPSKLQFEAYSGGGSYVQLPQAEPNGIFMPTAAEGTWVLMKDPGSNDVLPVYIEPRITVSPFKLPANMVQD